MSSPLIINYYTDVLCVWAWIAQRRIEEIEDQWNDKVILLPQYMDLFGNTEERINKGWQDRGGFDGFSRHVIESAEPFENAPVNSAIWKDVRPASSANAHLVLKAVELVHSIEISLSFAATVRESFFVDLMDIGEIDVLLSLAETSDLDTDKIKHRLNDGSAIATLMHDYQCAKNLSLKGSPSWVMNNGRQTLYGNVGYRILNANISEIINHPTHEVSWC